MEKFEKNTKILIVGLGLMGGSYAKALSKGGYAVRAVSREQEDIDFAVGGGFLESGSTEPKRNCWNGRIWWCWRFTLIR